MNYSGNINNFSVYRSHSTQGIGEGPGTSINAGAQFLNAEGPLLNKSILEDIRPWLILDSRERDHRELDDQLESWSLFSSHGYRFVARLVSAGTHGSAGRTSYFSHARAWFEQELVSPDFDPGLLVGRSEAFEKPWRDEECGDRVELPNWGMIYDPFLLVATEEKETLIRYLSNFYQASQKNKILIICAPLSEFTAGSIFHKLIGLARASLPKYFRDTCNLRVFARENLDGFIKNLRVLAIPDDLVNKALRYYPSAIFLDRAGKNLRNGIEPGAYFRKYSENTISRFVNLRCCLSGYSEKIDSILKTNSKNHSHSTPSSIGQLCQFAFNITRVRLGLESNEKIDFFEHYLIERFGSKYLGYEWETLLSNDDLNYLPFGNLLHFVLKIYKNENLQKLQNRVESYFALNPQIQKQAISELDRFTFDPNLVVERLEGLGATNSSLLSNELIGYFSDLEFPERLINLFSRILLMEIDDNGWPPSDEIESFAKRINKSFAQSAYGPKLISSISKVIKTHRPSQEEFCQFFKLMAPNVQQKIAYSVLGGIPLDQPNTYEQLIIEELFLSIVKAGKKITERPLEQLLYNLWDHQKKNIKNPIGFKLMALLTNSNNKTQAQNHYLEKLFSDLTPNQAGAEEILEQSLQHLIPDSFLKEESKREPWITKFPRQVLDCQIIKQHLNLSEISDILYSLEETNELLVQDLGEFYHQIDKEVRNPNTQNSTIFFVIQKGWWLPWRKETEIINENIFIEIAWKAILGKFNYKMSFEEWEAYASEFNNTKIASNRVQSNPIPYWVQPFEDLQIAKLVELASDFSVIDWVRRHSNRGVSIDIDFKTTLLKNAIFSEAEIHLYLSIAQKEKLYDSKDLEMFQDLLKHSGNDFHEVIKKELPETLLRFLPQNSYCTLGIAKKFNFFQGAINEFLNGFEKFISTQFPENTEQLTLIEHFFSFNKDKSLNLDLDINGFNIDEFKESYPNLAEMAGFGMRVDPELNNIWEKLKDVIDNHNVDDQVCLVLINEPEKMSLLASHILENIDHANFPNNFIEKAYDFILVTINETHNFDNHKFFQFYNAKELKIPFLELLLSIDTKNDIGEIIEIITKKQPNLKNLSKDRNWKIAWHNTIRERKREFGIINPYDRKDHAMPYRTQKKLLKC